MDEQEQRIWDATYGASFSRWVNELQDAYRAATYSIVDADASVTFLRIQRKIKDNA